MKNIISTSSVKHLVFEPKIEKLIDFLISKKLVSPLDNGFSAVLTIFAIGEKGGAPFLDYVILFGEDNDLEVSLQLMTGSFRNGLLLNKNLDFIFLKGAVGFPEDREIFSFFGFGDKIDKLLGIVCSVLYYPTRHLKEKASFDVFLERYHAVFGENNLSQEKIIFSFLEEHIFKD